MLEGEETERGYTKRGKQHKSERLLGPGALSRGNIEGSTSLENRGEYCSGKGTEAVSIMLPEESFTGGAELSEGVAKGKVSDGGGSEGKEMENDSLKILRDWLERQTHLPREVDDALLRQMLCRCNGSIEKTKTRLEAFFCLRTEISDIFSSRNPFSQESQTAYQTMMWSHLPRKTPKGNVVYVYRLRDHEPSRFSLESILRVAHMEMDELARNRGDGCVEANQPVAGLIYVFDLTGFTMAHIARMPLALIAKVFAYVHEGLYVKIREVHLLSHSTVVDRLMAFLKPLVRRIDKLHVHPANDLSSLFKHVPVKILPKEYGGEEDSLEELHRQRKVAVEEFGGWLCNEEKNQRVTEETLMRWRKGISWGLALGQSNSGADFGVDGSFRKLCLD